ncbi:MAG: nitroreductase family protein [Lachnospiraceae bacterium]|nr:nitroreductase family protein [Lachnospiraceae bacterium]
MTEKEAILQRHSVRNYENRPIEKEKVRLIEDKIKELNEMGNLKLTFVEDAGKTYNKLFNRVSGLGSAPSVIACIGKDAADLDKRIGYYGEKLVLYLQMLGLNTCWTGTFNKKTIDVTVKEDERLVIAIAVGYGKDQGKARKTKTADQVVSGKEEQPEWFKNGVEMALLAPTAINQQKFTICLNEDDTVDFIDNGGVLSQVDIGIVKCHFEIGAGKEV